MSEVASTSIEQEKKLLTLLVRKDESGIGLLHLDVSGDSIENIMRLELALDFLSREFLMSVKTLEFDKKDSVLRLKDETTSFSSEKYTLEFDFVGKDYRVSDYEIFSDSTLVDFPLSPKLKLLAIVGEGLGGDLQVTAETFCPIIF